MATTHEVIAGPASTSAPAAGVVSAPAKYVPPAMRRQQERSVAPDAGDQSRNDSQGGRWTNDHNSNYRDDRRTHNASSASASSAGRNNYYSGGGGTGRRDFGGPTANGGDRNRRPGGGGMSAGYGDRRQMERNSRWNTFEGGDDHRPAAQRSSGTGTGWDVRDGRPYRREEESEIFKNEKQKSAGVNFDSYEAIPVEVSGRVEVDYTALNYFAEAKGVHPIVAANIERVNYQKPTPVQKHAIPVIGLGRDLMACAQTGSGKTAAFLFPIISKMLRDGPPDTAGRRRMGNVAFPVTLVFSPTRELASQIFEESRKFAFGSGIRTVVLYGGAPASHQMRELGYGCDICVATPGRLDDLKERGKIDFGQVQYLVLDEADRMLDMGFEPKIKELVLESGMTTSEEGRQTVMFSATFPRVIQVLASRFLSDYVFLTVGRVGSTNDFIDQEVEYVPDSDKNDRLEQVLNKVMKQQPEGLILVFVETKRKADTVEVFLMDKQVKCTSIHGDRDQSEREYALKHFRSGAYPILVATDVAARGLDIPNIRCVINLDLPSSIDDYVHRIGRTGRAGNHGRAISFVNEKNGSILRSLLSLFEEAGQDVPGWFTDMVRTVSSAGRNFGRFAGSGGGGGYRGGGASGGAGRYSGGRQTNSRDPPPGFGGRDIRSAESERRVGGGSSGGGGGWRTQGNNDDAGRGRTTASRPNTSSGGRADDDDGW